MPLTRRDFVAASLFASVPAWNVSAAESKSKSKVDRLACNSWPFRAYFDTPQMHQYRKAEYPLLTQAEFPRFLADTFAIHNVEFLPQHFVDTEPSTINAVKAGLKKANSRCCNLMGVEIPGGVFDGGASRDVVIKEAERWTRIATDLGSPSITIALNGKEPFDPKTAASTLAPFVDIAHRRNIKVLFHNDDLKHESAEILTAVINQLGRAKTGSCPDFGNFATKSAAFALEQLKMLAPYASHICHSKDGIADDGKFYPDDFAASMKVMHDAGFRGIYSLEFESLGESVAGVRTLMEMTEKYLAD